MDSTDRQWYHYSFDAYTTRNLQATIPKDFPVNLGADNDALSVLHLLFDAWYWKYQTVQNFKLRWVHWNPSCIIRKCLSIFFYMSQHWLFAFFYFRVAINFKLIFSFRCEEVQRKLQTKMIFLRIFGLAGFSLIGLPWLVLAVLGN